MIPVLVTILAVVLVISLISLIGVFTLSIKGRSLQEMLFLFVSFAVGSMLAAALLELLPEALDANPPGYVFGLVILGIMVSFVMEQFIAHHHCHSHNCKHRHIKPEGYLNLFGDGVHNFIDGMIVSASFLASPGIGISSSLAIIAHEIPQEIGDFAVLLHSGFTRVQALWFNFLSALTAIAGALVAYFFSFYVAHFTTALSAFAVGNFLYLALTDLVPSLHHETDMRRSVLQFLMMLLGIAVIVGVAWLVPD